MSLFSRIIILIFYTPNVFMFCCILHLYVYQIYEFVVYFFNNYAKRTLKNVCIILSANLSTGWYICQFPLSVRSKYVKPDISIL